MTAVDQFFVNFVDNQWVASVTIDGVHEKFFMSPVPPSDPGVELFSFLESVIEDAVRDPEDEKQYMFFYYAVLFASLGYKKGTSDLNEVIYIARNNEFVVRYAQDGEHGILHSIIRLENNMIEVVPITKS